jgi:hypothetical protein
VSDTGSPEPLVLNIITINNMYLRLKTHFIVPYGYVVEWLERWITIVVADASAMLTR